MKKLILLILAAIVILLPQSARAYDWEAAYKSAKYKSEYYDPVDICGASETGEIDAGLSGNDNAQKAFNFFIQAGLRDFQSAAVVGNLWQESRLLPTNQQDKSKDPFPKPNIGFGLAQWTTPARQAGLTAYAAANNTVVTDFTLQLNYIWKELTGTAHYGLSQLKIDTNIVDATQTVMDRYESPDPKYAMFDNRLKFARDTLALYAGEAPEPGTASTEPSVNCLTAGGATNFLDGFVIYSQYNPLWAKKLFGGTTIADGGCGPSAMAMVITNLTGKSVTPDVVASYAASQGMYIPGVGSSWSIAPVTAKHWGLKATFLGPSIAKINATLQAGGLVVTSGGGPLPFTSAGHYIVIRALTPDGKWRIGDSGHVATNTKDWRPEDIIAYVRDGSVYGISK
jgi:hypothetical protein